MSEEGPSRYIDDSSLVEGNIAPDGWSHVVASLLAQHTALLQKLAAAAFVGPAFPVCLPLPAPPQRPGNSHVPRASDWDRRKWRNRRNRHRKKLRRLFSNARRDAQFTLESREVRETHVQRMLQSVISVRETHAVAEAQQQKNARLKEAFGISEFFVEGSSLDPDRKNKEEAARQAHHQEVERRNRRHEWIHTPTPSPPRPTTEQKDKKEKKKKKKRTRDRSSSPESRSKRKSKKSKRSR